MLRRERNIVYEKRTKGSMGLKKEKEREMYNAKHFQF